ncbi:MAG: polysaccharide biosynthesis/export family protein [Terriglobales bacterium]
MIALLLLGMMLFASLGQGQQATDATKAASTAPQAAAGLKAGANVNPDEYIIGTDDVLNINVWKEPELTRTVPVRPDGKITLPLINDIQASGKTPHQLQADITKALAAFMSNADVSVSVQEVKSQRFNIMGEVQKPGAYGLTGPTTILDAIALAGGLKDFAKGKKIYVLRTKPDGSQVKLPFNYSKVIKGEGMEENIRLEPKDTIVVP